MKAIKLNRIIKFVATAAIILPGILFLQSCSQKISFATSSVVPAAEGSVKVKKDKNENYNIDLSVMRLADPKRLDPSKKMYIVWADTRLNGVKNMGQLNTSSSFLSSTLRSSLKTVSPYKPTRIFITAENDAAIQYPGSQVILSTGNF